IGDRNVTTVPWPLAPQSKPRSLSKTFCRTFSTLSLSGIAASRFAILNAISSVVWAALFCTVGYVFGLGAERIVGQALARHERLLIALAIGLVVAILGWVASHFFAKKELRKGS
ncbi:hypothetical protein NKJ84_25870, partial [Mesorhizobium sp. M0048]